MEKRKEKPKFTDIVCPNKACKFHGGSGQGKMVNNETYEINNGRV
jgi:hypothetical protein